MEVTSGIFTLAAGVIAATACFVPIFSFGGSRFSASIWKSGSHYNLNAYPILLFCALAILTGSLLAIGSARRTPALHLLKVGADGMLVAISAVEVVGLIDTDHQESGITLKPGFYLLLLASLVAIVGFITGVVAKPRALSVPQPYGAPGQMPMAPAGYAAPAAYVPTQPGFYPAQQPGAAAPVYQGAPAPYPATSAQATTQYIPQPTPAPQPAPPMAPATAPTPAQTPPQASPHETTQVHKLPTPPQASSDQTTQMHTLPTPPNPSAGDAPPSQTS